MTSRPPAHGHVPFDRIVDEHGPTVLRVCRSVVGPDDADDAWSDTFLAALRAYPDLEHPADVRAWLITIAHRKAIDILRRRARSPIPHADVPEPSPPADRSRDEDRGRAWDALASLSGRQRQIVVYHHVAGLPYREIAVIVGGSEAAVRRAGADGIAALRRILTDAPTPPEPSS